MTLGRAGKARTNKKPTGDGTLIPKKVRDLHLRLHPPTKKDDQPMLKRPTNTGPDFTHGGEFVDWGDEGNALDEHFPALIEIASNHIGTDVELVRWSPDDPAATELGRWWAKQGHAVRRHVGPVAGLKVTTRSRTHRDLGVKIGYVRFNRTRPQIVRDEVAS
jgi:hypothetical protein